MKNQNYIGYAKSFFDKGVAPLLIKEIFKKNDSIEIINFLENKYQNITTSYEDEDLCDVNEQILLKLNNELINMYLIRYCKSKNTFFYLLELDNNLINQGIFNLNIIYSNENKLIKYLVKNQNILNIFFIFYFEASNLIWTNLIYSFINKENEFSLLSEDVYFSILEVIFTHNKITDLIEKESEPYSELSSNRICYSIWNLLENLEVNEKSIALLSSIGSFGHERLDKPYNTKTTSKQLLKKWSSYNYNEVKRDNEFDFRTSKEDFQDRTNIQILIASYANYSNPLNSEYEGVRAHGYMHCSIDTFLKDAYANDDYSKEAYIKYIKDNQDNILFEYFKLNYWNYTEKYFDVVYETMKLDRSLIIENFETIGKSILVLDWWDINSLLEENNLSENKKNYYKTLYYMQKLKLDNNQINELIDKQNSVINIVENKKCTLW